MAQKDRPVWLVVNSASGRYSEDSVAGVYAALAAAGRKPARVMDCKYGAFPDRAALEQEDIATLAIFGGDGTSRSCLKGVEGWGGAALVLPGGTTNLLARAIFGGLALDDIVAGFGRGELAVTRRPCLRWSTGSPERAGREYTLALTEVLAGPGARWGDVREDLREGAVAAMVTESVDITQESLTGGQVRVADPQIGRESGYPGLRLVPGAEGIRINGYHMDNLAEWFSQGLAIVRRNFREGPHDALGSAMEVLCRSTDGDRIELLVDGERRSAGNQVRFSLDSFDLNLLGPPA